MSGFVKIYGSIIRSTVWQQPASTKLAWLTMLILADCNGKVEASIPGLAATAGVTIEECEAALLCFSSPDRYSTSKTDEGRRIRECAGGWLIINHGYYRELRTEKQIKDAQRIAAKRARDTSPIAATCRDVATDPNTNTNTEIKEDTSCSAPPNADSPPLVDQPRASNPTAAAGEKRDDDVSRVFEHWKAALGHPRAKLDAKRSRLIRARLAQFTIADLCQAIDGCAASDFHMGRHAKTNGQRNDGIGLICRDAEHIERFMRMALVGPANSSEPEESWL